MTIERGPQSHKRQAKNYIHKQAQARLHETVPTYNQQAINSLAVDSVMIDYFSVFNRIGQSCSCRATQVETPRTVVDGEKTDISNHSDHNHVASPGASIQLQDTGLFGEEAERIYEDEGIDVTGADEYDYDPDIPDVLYEPKEKLANAAEQRNVGGANNECGICYRAGLQPGYVRYGTMRTLLTSLNVAGINNVMIDKDKAPHVFRNHTRTGHVVFELSVPKYFVGATYSVRLNTQVLKGQQLYWKGKPLTMDVLKINAGTKIDVSVHAQEFTHAVVEFETGVERIRGNISAESRGLDYTMRDSISNFTVVLPPNIPDVRNADIIVIRERRLVLKVTEAERDITADAKQLKWVVQTRMVQPQEAVKNIYKSFKIG